MPLDLLVPDLLAPPDAPAAMRDLRLPGLEKWLARADLERSEEAGATRWLARRFALPSPPPVAAVALAGEGDRAEGAWMRADPVHLRIDGDALVLHDAAVLGLTREEAEPLVAALQSLFDEDRLRFRAPSPERWYVEVPEVELPTTVPLEEARGRDPFGLLPTGSGRINWRSAITEAQMVLAAHDVNARREAAGAPLVNSVWFWGEGPTPASVDRPYAAVHAREAFARGLAALSGAAAPPVPKSVAELAAPGTASAVLVVLDELAAPWSRVDAAGWRAAAEGLDRAWFRDLGEAIERFGTVRIVLPRATDTLVAVLSGRARRRWLRRSRPLATHG
ncbi:MAG TPA: hypothetical protein VEG27_00260 [Usitatibacter sp.]|nr:hypothetical protein [Usitatibacter sp.]